MPPEYNLNCGSLSTTESIASARFLSVIPTAFTVGRCTRSPKTPVSVTKNGHANFSFAFINTFIEFCPNPPSATMRYTPLRCFSTLSTPKSILRDRMQKPRYVFILLFSKSFLLNFPIHFGSNARRERLVQQLFIVELF